jgi:hypothetical protein
LYAENYKEQKAEETQKIITTAWLTAYYSRLNKLPELKTELDKIGKTKTEMTDSQMLEQVKALNSLFGGKVEYGSS